MRGVKGVLRLRGGWVLGCALSASLSVGAAGCAESHRVRMNDMNSLIGQLSGLDGDPLEKEKVEYMSTGKSQYDQFFKSAAEMRAGIVVSRALSENTTTNLKKYARSYAASQAADENIKAIVGDTKLEDLSEEQSIALLNLKKKRGELSADEKKFATSAAASTAQTGLYLDKTGEQAKALVDTGTSLSQSVQSDFTGLEVTKAPAVSKSLAGSLDNLKEASVKAPALAKTLARLGEGLKSLL